MIASPTRRSPAVPGAGAGGFDVMLGNPPWERVKLQEKEWFATRHEAIATASSGAKRKKLIDALATDDPPLHAAFRDACRVAEGASHFLRDSGCFPLCGRGDVNTYTVFAELFRDSLASRGRSGCVVPSGIATDDTTKFFFQSIVDSRSLSSLLSFENEEFIFPSIHHATKFCLLTLTGVEAPSSHVSFGFFLRRAEHAGDQERVFTLSAEDIALVNPNTRTCPIFRTRRDAEITKGIYRRVPVLVDESKGPAGNPWGVTFNTMFHMTNDSHLFHTREELEAEGWTLEGNVFVRGEERMLPLYEAKMFHLWEPRFGTFEGQTEAQARQGKLPELCKRQLCDPTSCTIPRYWIAQTEHGAVGGPRLAFRNITGAAVSRTMICSILPGLPLGHSASYIETRNGARQLGLCSAMSSFCFDFALRQKVGGLNMSFFFVRQAAIPMPPQSAAKTPQWKTIEQGACELLYTASSQSMFNLTTHGTFRFSLSRRFQMQCEVDAAFFHLYGINRDDANYIMDSFRLVEHTDEEKYGHYRTKDRILRIYDEMAECMARGKEWKSPLDPPPGDPRACWTEDEMDMWRRCEGEHLIEKYRLLDEELDT